MKKIYLKKSKFIINHDIHIIKTTALVQSNNKTHMHFIRNKNRRISILVVEHYLLPTHGY
jgi:hypothetical protein